jgi:hypothetical protein
VVESFKLAVSINIKRPVDLSRSELQSTKGPPHRRSRCSPRSAPLDIEAQRLGLEVSLKERIVLK